MKRFKILIGATLLVLLFVVATASTYSAHTFEETITDTLTTKTVVNDKEVQQYKLHEQELNNAIATYFEKAIKAGDIVGAGVSIVKGDLIVLSEGFGKRSISGTRCMR